MSTDSLEDKITTIRDAQKAVKRFVERNHWEDIPNIDKIDHLHEELCEISQHLRYKPEAERVIFVKDNQKLFTKELGDVLFGLCRLANQMGVDLETGFNQVKEKVFNKYSNNTIETNVTRPNWPA